MYGSPINIFAINIDNFNTSIVFQKGCDSQKEMPWMLQLHQYYVMVVLNEF